MRRWGWRFISRIGALALLALFLGLISLPNLIDLENYRPQLLEYLQSRISGEVSLGKLKLTFQHGPGVRIEGIKIVDQSGIQQISIASTIINFDLSHLFRRHIRLSRMTLVQPRILLQVDRGVSPLSGFLRPVTISAAKSSVDSVAPSLDKIVSSDDGKVGPGSAAGFFRYCYFDSNISQALLEIVDGSVVLTDRCFGVSPVVTHLEDLNLLMEWQESGIPTKFTLATRAHDKHEDGSLKIEGTLSSLQWPLEPEKMFLDCQIDAENLNAATYFPYYQKYVPMRFIGARVDIDSNYRGNLMGLFRSQGRIVLHQAELDYQQVFNQKLNFNCFAVDYDFRLADRYNTIETLKCAIDADGFKIKGHCLLHEARRGIDGTIEAGLEIDEFDPSSISYLLPWKILPEKIRNYYQLLQPGSGCVIDNAYLKGDYRQIVRLAGTNPPLGVVGCQINGENLAFKIKDDRPFFTILAANAAFDGKILNIVNLNFDWDGLSGEAVNLSLRELFYEPQIEGAGQFEFNLERLQPSLEKLLAGDHDKWAETLSKISCSGFLQGDLALKGALANLAGITWGGMLDGHDLAFEFAGEPLTISRGEASFILDRNQIIVEDASFNLACLPLTLQGSLPGPAHWFGGNSGRDLGLDLALKAQDFAPEDLDCLLGDKYSVSGKRIGPSPLELHLSGDCKNLLDLQFQGKLSLDWGDIAVPFMAKSFEHLNCLATFNRERVDFQRLFIEQGDSDLSFKGGLVRDSDDSGYLLHGDVAADRLLVADFIPLLKQSADQKIASKVEPEESMSGTVLAAKKTVNNYVVEKKSSDENQTRKFPPVKVDLDGVFKQLVLPVGTRPGKTQGSRAPWHYLNDFTFSCFSASDAPVIINECRWGWGEQRSQVMVSGQLQYQAKDLDGDLEVVVQDLDLDALLQQPERTQVEQGEAGAEDLSIDNNVRLALLDELSESVNSDAVKSLLLWKNVLARNNLHLQARAQHLRWQQMTIDEIEGDCILDNSGVYLKKIDGRSFGGGVHALAQWSYADDSFVIKSELTDIDFETFNDYLKNPDRGLPMQGGQGSLNLDLVWQGGSLQGWKESLGGQLNFVFHEGRLKKFTLLANVCSLLNLSQFAALRLPEISVDQGVPYQTLSGQGKIVDGVLEVDDFAMRGTAVNILCDGVISLVDEQVDLNIGVQPLQTVDKLLATIPVVGYIITGDQKTFVVIPMSVSGPFDDIKIKTHTVAGLGKKAGGMIQRFFKTPVRLLQMPGKLLGRAGSEGSAEKLQK